MNEALTREIKIIAGYDYRDEPNDQRGAHGAELILILRGPLGVIAAKISTGWVARPVIGHVVHGRPQRRREKPGVDDGVRDCYPSGSYVGSHTPARIGDDEENGGACSWLGTDVCYGTGGYLAGDKVLELLVTQGSDAAFDHLEGLYESWIASPARECTTA